MGDEMRDDLAIIISNEERGSMAAQLGAAHYSYRFAEGKFRDILTELADVRYAKYPYAYASKEYVYQDLELESEKLIHLAFRSPENLRVLKGLYNICAVAWEFDVMHDTDWRGQNPIKKQTRMLGLFDEIWATSTYTQSVLSSHGLKNVQLIPAPVDDVWENPDDFELNDLGGVQFYPVNMNVGTNDMLYSHGLLSKEPKGIPEVVRKANKSNSIYLTILNPFDMRKNLLAMLCGFEAFAKEHPDATLLVKLSVPKADSRVEQSQAIVHSLRISLGEAFSMKSKNIFFIFGYLSDDEMSSLHAVSDFYLAPAVAEGQNLPLIEAMTAGTIGVATRNTAMLDYIDTDNSVVINTKRLPAAMLDLATREARKYHEIDIASSYDIYLALKQTAKLSSEQREAMGKKGKARCKALYAPSVIKEKVSARLSSIVGKVAAS